VSKPLLAPTAESIFADHQAISVAVAVVRVREMGMRVSKRLMAMPVCMPCPRLDRRHVLVIVMVIVVNVFVFMLEYLMEVFVLMSLAQVQPDSESHQQPCAQQRYRDGLAENERKQCSEERSDGKIRTGSRRTQVTQRNHEERKTRTIGQQADEHCTGD
jgi:hypothetical protein